MLISHDELSLSAPLHWSVCVFLVRSASNIICHLHKIDKCHMLTVIQIFGASLVFQADKCTEATP